jgi:hypothetical protein
LEGRALPIVVSDGEERKTLSIASDKGEGELLG